MQNNEKYVYGIIRRAHDIIKRLSKDYQKIIKRLIIYFFIFFIYLFIKI